MTSYTTGNFSLGPCVVKIGPTGATPSLDLGAVESVSLELNTDVERITQGTPRQPVFVLPAEESATLTFSGIEWNINNFVRGTGSGATESATKFTYGGGPTMQEFALLAEHAVLGSGDTISIRMWRVVPSGSFPVTMDDAVNTFEMTFDVLRTTTDWAGNTIGGRDDKNSMLEVERTAAP